MSAAAVDRLAARFARLKSEGRAGLVTFVTASDPDFATSLAIVKGLPKAGADVIELGMPFTDPMADGPAIQAASQRALKAGMTLKKTLDLVRGFRESDKTTPLVLMGYYNPVYIYGVDRFLDDAIKAGVDGLIMVDMPPEEDAELCLPAIKKDLAFIRLATPTTDDARLPKVLSNSTGFVYYVSILGITGTRSVDDKAVREAMARIRRHTSMPVAVGFGIKTPGSAAAIARDADAAVVGSAIVQAVADTLDAGGKATDATVGKVLGLVRDLAQGVRGARKG